MGQDMGNEEKIAASETVCRNCRYLSCTQGQGLRCADPASADFDHTVAPRGTCGRFQIGFQAARQLASEQRGPNRSDAWDMTMAHRNTLHRIGTRDVRT